MNKILEGKVISMKMQNTAIVEVVRRTPHSLYRKLIRRSKKYKADTGELNISVGDMVKMMGTKPMSKDKYFKITEILNLKGESKKKTQKVEPEKIVSESKEKKTRRIKK